MVRSRIQRQPAQRLGDEAGLAQPAVDRDVDGLMEFQTRIVLPVLQFGGVEEVPFGARAGDEHDPPVALAVGERAEHHRPQRRQADTAGDDDQIPTAPRYPIPTLVPNGPRTPTVAPGSAAHRAALTAPTARMVWTTAPSEANPHTEIATSPTPNA